MSTIFVVDDDKLMREMLKRLLSKNGHTVETFSTPQAVLDSDVVPSLLITDLQMPGMSGLDLVQKLQQSGREIPVILMSGHLSQEVSERAATLGIDDLIDKPIPSLDGFVESVHRILGRGANSIPNEGLDRVRVDFLTGLSHEIRTPLTAIKLALDGLFGKHTEMLSPEQRKLVGISHRNIDRIVGVVERQLDLLQIALGDVALVRRLVNLNELIEDAQRLVRPTGRHAEMPERTGVAATGSTYLFADPQRLRTVIEYILERRVCQDPIAVHVDTVDGHPSVVVGFGKTTIGQEADTEASIVDPASTGEAYNFEFRACERLMDALGGRITISNDALGYENTRLEIPILPDYDRRSDFILPLKSLRKTAKLGEQGVSFFRAEIVESDDAMEHELLRRSLSTISDGEMLVRGRCKGTYYMGLVGRKTDEIESLLAFLSGAGDGNEDRLRIRFLHKILPGDTYPEDLLLDLEAVT